MDIRYLQGYRLICHEKPYPQKEAIRRWLDRIEEPFIIDFEGNHVLGKPEGVASEFADTIIRILDYSGHAEIPTIQLVFQKMMFNRTRTYRHGNKRC